MLEKIKNHQKLLIILSQTILIYLIFWFLLRNLKTDGIWETVILNILFFGIFSKLLLKNKKIEKEGLENKKKLVLKLEIIAVWLVFGLVLFVLKDLSFLKLNYLARIGWYLGDWWLIFLLNIFLVPVVLFSQELFFRKFLFEKLNDFYSIKTVLIIQTSLFVLFEILFFEVFGWQFLIFNFLLGFLASYFYYKTKNIWYSVIMRWGLVLILDSFILSKIQNLKG
jgi:membrane protease YdiL (CAAX protease family)